MAGIKPAEGTSTTPKVVEHIPTLEEYVAAGYKAETYEARFANSVEPTAEQIAAAEEAAAKTSRASTKGKAKADAPYHYCLEENHPGAPSFQSSPLSLVRIFQSDLDVPVCPACGRQVNSMPCEGADIPPASILELQERFGR